LVLSLLALIPIAFVSGCKKEAAPETVVTVQAEHPEQGSISDHIVADAVLAPLAQAAITPKITAPVARFYVQRGQRVKAGELLVTLENLDLSAAAQDNHGSYIAAQAAYDTATKAQVPEDTLKSESDLAEAKANLDLNLSIVKARKQLFAEGAIPGRDLDTAQAAMVQAQAAYDAASKHLDSVRTVSREAALKSAQGQLTSAEGKYNGAAAEVSYSHIHSPIDGVVTDRPLFAGETATAGTPLITVMDTSSLIAKAHIAQSLAQRMKLGDAATVSVPGITEPVEARVALVSPALDPGSTTVEVWLKIDNRKGTLKVGTPVKVAITGRTEPKALKIPATALLTAQDGSTSVMVIGNDGVAHRKPVTVGIADADDVQILTGLTSADQIVSGGAYGLDDGAKVKVGPAAADDDAKPAPGKAGGDKE
jgi:multidrug efflux pump subunit AcrA (membrane-fusion protein)